jgi:hypothetical protein
MRGEIVPLFAMMVGLIIAVTKILTSTISRHRLDVEKIRADAMVRAEEVRTRNELELEKLMRQDQSVNNTGNGTAQSDSDNERRNTKERIRD